jgi:regulator of replication initiation timing
MAKLGNPLGKGKTVWISQTYHGTHNQAIDIGNLKEGTPLYAVGDGTISTVGSYYCILDLGESKLRSWYVHCKALPKKGKVFKAGEKVCEVGKSSSIHLHKGLTWKDGHSPRPNIMDYFDRSIVFKTKYADIKKSWFAGTDNLNWELFKDLDYKTNKPIPIPKPPIPEPTECEKRVQILEDSLDALTGDYRALQDQFLKLSEEAKIMIAENVELHIQLKEMNEKYGTLMIERNTLKNENARLIDEVNQGVGMYTTGELFSELWRRLFARK